MRLEVLCQDRPGLVGELLELLVNYGVDLYGIEIRDPHHLYLRLSPMTFADFSLLMSEIRRTPDVTDVRRINYMPSERGRKALLALLEALPDPVLSADLTGKIELANPAAQDLFGISETQLMAQSLTQLIPPVAALITAEVASAAEAAQVIAIQGRDFLMEIRPLYLPADDSQDMILVGHIILLRSIVRMGQQSHPLHQQNPHAFNYVIAESPKMRHLVTQAKKLALHEAPLLIVGETGTGKDLLARACHQYSRRNGKPFLGLNCASLPDDVVESELFGHAAWAYPIAQDSQKGFFEQANGGSVFLDEIGEMSPHMQTKLLRFLNDGTFRRVGEEHEVHVDVRIICATQKNLQQLVAEGTFREDLFYRLNVLTLALPPLREHPQDIPGLTTYFISGFANEQGMTVPKLSPQLAGYLARYHWPGNIRQLKNSLYLAMTQLEGNELRPQDVPLPEQDTDRALDSEMLEGSLDEITGRFERSVLESLYATYPSTRKLAKRLGVSHTAIANKLREHGIGIQRLADNPGD